MDLHLEGKVIFVTGGFKGIGKGIALQLAREGAIPVVLNRKDGVEDEFRAEISEITKTFEMYYIDLNDTDAIKPIVEEVYKKYQEVLNGDNVTQEEVEEANKAIEEAFKNLVAKDDGKKDPTPTPGPAAPTPTTTPTTRPCPSPC